MQDFFTVLYVFIKDRLGSLTKVGLVCRLLGGECELSCQISAPSLKLLCNLSLKTDSYCKGM